MFDEKPYKLFNGDCLEVLPTLADKIIDCVITDLPYGTTACKWDVVIPFEPMWKEIKRIVKPKGAIVLFGSQPFTSALVASNLKCFRYEWIWNKNRGSNFAVQKYQPMKEHENICVFSFESHNYFPFKESRKGGGLSRSKYAYSPSNTGKRDFIGGFRMNHADHNGNCESRFPSSVQKFNCEVGLHPNQKPVELLRYLIKTYTLENETVLDFTMGSGSTGVACMAENRKFIGIEKDENYFKIAEARIKRANLEPCDIPKRQNLETVLPLFQDSQ